MENNSVGIRVAGAVAGAIVGTVAAYLGLDWLKPAGGAVGLLAFFAAAGAFIGLVIAMNVELYRSGSR